MDDQPESTKLAQAKLAKPKGRLRKRSSVKASAKKTAWTFPKNTLEDAISIPKAIEEKNAGHPMAAPALAVAVGFKQTNDWRFLDLARSAHQYGLIDWKGASTPILLTSLGQDVVAPSSANQRSEALLKAFRNVESFEAVERFYGGKRIPEDEFFLNTLNREFNIPRDRVEVFAEIFLKNLQYLRAFTRRPTQAEVAATAGDIVSAGVGRAQATVNEAGPREPRVREFLDTCFVMMPFGAWFDRYYQEIYAPAIKDAGFEPVRADELFSTGSVVEQIWEQIVKAKLLLADLTGKNANVFYELGLAHAARKPVIFTSAVVDDVPFDLRHLRVIIYDVREPEWASILRKSIADYLRNATRDPGKSIPHPFRLLTAEREEEEEEEVEVEVEGANQ